jgi:hypothetical protein
MTAAELLFEQAATHAWGDSWLRKKADVGDMAEFDPDAWAKERWQTVLAAAGTANMLAKAYVDGLSTLVPGFGLAEALRAKSITGRELQPWEQVLSAVPSMVFAKQLAAAGDTAALGKVVAEMGHMPGLRSGAGMEDLKAVSKYYDDLVNYGSAKPVLKGKSNLINPTHGRENCAACVSAMLCRINKKGARTAGEIESTSGSVGVGKEILLTTRKKAAAYVRQAVWDQGVEVDSAPLYLTPPSKKAPNPPFVKWANVTTPGDYVLIGEGPGAVTGGHVTYGRVWKGRDGILRRRIYDPQLNRYWNWDEAAKHIGDSPDIYSVCR